MKEEKSKSERPEAYPKPTETDNQVNNQPEYIDQQPNSFDNDLGDVPLTSTSGNSDGNRGRNA